MTSARAPRTKGLIRHHSSSLRGPRPRPSNTLPRETSSDTLTHRLCRPPAPGTRTWPAERSAPPCPHQITIQPQTARQDGKRLLARRPALYYRLRQRSPVPVGGILQPLSPMATPASLSSALPYIPLNPVVDPDEPSQRQAITLSQASGRLRPSPGDRSGSIQER